MRNCVVCDSSCDTRERKEEMEERKKKKWINTSIGGAWEHDRGQRMCLPEYRCRWYHGGSRCYGRCWGWKNWRTRWWPTSSRGAVNSIINHKSSILALYYPSTAATYIVSRMNERKKYPWNMIKKKKIKRVVTSFSIRFSEWKIDKEYPISKFYQ